MASMLNCSLGLKQREAVDGWPVKKIGSNYLQDLRKQLTIKT
jgi:hypothetical protein